MNTHSKRHGFIWLEQILQDIRFSLRMLRKNPGFTGIAVLSLALAIGVNSGVFSIVNAMLFKPIFPLRPNEVVSVYQYERTAHSIGYKGFSFSEFLQLQESQEVFADVAAFQETTAGVGAGANAEIRKSKVLIVSGNYFSMLGLTPAMGRFFLPEESKPNATIPVAVVSRSFWKSMGGGSDFSERTVKINGDIYDVVGVAPNGFSGTTSLVAPDVWLPIGMVASVVKMPPIPGLSVDDFLQIYAIGRLQPGLTLAAAKARLDVVTSRLGMIVVDTADETRSLEIAPPSRFDIFNPPSKGDTITNPMTGEIFTPSTMDENGYIKFVCALMTGIAGVVLLVACLNLANMFLARNLTRSDELSVRLALGAARWRIVRILSVEGLIIALMGGAVGLVLSHWGNVFLLGALTRVSAFSSGPGQASLLLDTTPDIRVLLAALLFCVIATLVFALIPAWHIIRDITRGSFSLQHSNRTTTDRWGRLFSGRNCLLMAQLALSLALLFGAGVFIRSLNSAARLDLGFSPEGALVAEIDYSLVDRDEGRVWSSITALEDALGAYPDVRNVAFASDIPFENSGFSGFKVSAAGATDNQERRAEGRETSVSRGYFDALGIKLLRGRDFTEQECRQAEGPSVVIIDQGTASALFPGEDPVGKYIQNVLPELIEPMPEEIMEELKETAKPMQIIGVVSAHRDDVIADSPPLRLFYPLVKSSRQFSWQPIYVILRGQTTEMATSGTFRELMSNKLLGPAPDIPLVRLTPYTDILDSDMILWMLKSGAVLLGIFGAIALLIAVIGVYGVKAFVVACRMREIGIRMALGASPRRIYTLLMKQGAALVAVGLCVGSMLSLAAGRLLASLTIGTDLDPGEVSIPRLLRVSPGDPLVLALAALVLALAALLAAWLPARRAAKVDPMEVLRWE